MNKPNGSRALFVFVCSAFAFVVGIFLAFFSTPGGIYGPGLGGYIAAAGFGVAIGSLAGIVIGLVFLVGASAKRKTQPPTPGKEEK